MSDFESSPDRYVHWKLEIDGAVARLSMNVDPEKTFRPGYKLKLNSYDLGVDIELADVIQRLRFEHPDVKVVVVTSANPRVFCAGANIHMLATSSHPFKVNFCKFTNETRCSIEDATAHSDQIYLAALNGTASGGGYELASACAEIYLADDGNSAVSLPEIPLLGVLPGTGGLTRLVDKRKIRRDLADVFSTLAEGLKARRAKEWGFVDGSFPKSRFDEEIAKRAAALAAGQSNKNKDGAKGIRLGSVAPKVTVTTAAAGAGAGIGAGAYPSVPTAIATPERASERSGPGTRASAPGNASAGAVPTDLSTFGTSFRASSTNPPLETAGTPAVAVLASTTRAGGDGDTVLFEYRYVTLRCDRARRLAELTVSAPSGPQPATAAAIREAGSEFWALRAFRELDDALCRLRFDEEEIGLVLLRTRGSEAGRKAVLEIDRLLAETQADWLVNEILLLMARVLRRLDLTAKSLFALIDEESCFAGSLFELALAADRIFMKNDDARRARIAIGPLSAGRLPMPNGLSRLRSRFLSDATQADRLTASWSSRSVPPAKGEPATTANERSAARASASAGAQGSQAAATGGHEDVDAPAALDAGLVTFAPDELDWDDAVRVAIEERLSLSPDALTGMEASLRFGGPETTDSKIYGRLSAWQNWIFIRPNATGEHGALKLYGQPERPKFDWRRT